MVAYANAAPQLVRTLNDDPGLGGVGGDALLDERGAIVGTEDLRGLPNELIAAARIEPSEGNVSVQRSRVSTCSCPAMYSKRLAVLISCSSAMWRV